MVAWRTWQPEEVATEADVEDVVRFGRCVRCVTDEWITLAGNASRTDATLKWLHVFQNLYDTRAEFAANDLQLAAKTLLDIVLCSEHDLWARVSWSRCLVKLLRHYRRELTGLTIHWRPLYGMLKSATGPNVEPSTGSGMSLSCNAISMELIRKSRRFFPPGSAAEIWSEFSPGLFHPLNPEAFISLGWLTAFLPTTAASSGEGEWANWVAHMLQAWQGIAHSYHWNSLWLGIFGRLAKHDVLGLVDWPAVQPVLLTHMLWTFQVPVGTATASAPFTVDRPAKFSQLFSRECPVNAKTISKILVHLIGRGPPTSDCPQMSDPPPPPATDLALTHIRQLCTVLEQYYHPSNGGKWSASLAKFLETFCKALSKRLTAEGNGVIDTTVPDGVGPCRPRAHLSDKSLAQLDCIVKLASKAQFSKDDSDFLLGMPGGMLGALARSFMGGAGAALEDMLEHMGDKDPSMMSAGCNALRTFAAILPNIVLPLVHKRFMAALEAVTATHQLSSSITTLAVCARPLMIAGINAEDDVLGIEGQTAQQVAAEAISAAMTLTLPAIDANDPKKTVATLNLYAVVLSSVGHLQGGSAGEVGEYDRSGLPLYIDKWVEDFLSAIFSILRNLDSPEEGPAAPGETSASFLLQVNSLFAPVVRLLFPRLPEEVMRRAIRQVGRFVCSTRLPSVTQEAAFLVQAAASANPQAAAEHILVPLLDQLDSEVPIIQSASAAGRAGSLSKVHESTLLWQLGVLGGLLPFCSQHLVAHKGRLVAILEACISAPSQTVQFATSNTLSGVLTSLVSYRPESQYGPGDQQVAVGGLALESWYDKFGTGCARLKWIKPSAGEIGLATELLQRFAEKAADELVALCKPPSPLPPPADPPKFNPLHKRGSSGILGSSGGPPKDKLWGLLLGMEGVVKGLGVALPDFKPILADVVPGEPLQVVGSCCVTVGTVETREKLAGAVKLALENLNEADGDSLTMLVGLAGLLLAAGSNEQEDFSTMKTAWRSTNGVVAEAPVNARLWKQQGSEAVGYKPYCYRRPAWLIMYRAQYTNLWRASQATYRWWYTTKVAVPSVDMLSRTYLQLAGQVQGMCFHRYKVVREAAFSVMDECMRRYKCLKYSTARLGMRALAGLPLSNMDAAGSSEALSAVCMDGKQWAAVADAMNNATAGSKSGTKSGDDDKQDEGLAVGACAILQDMSLAHVVHSEPHALASLIAAILSARQYDSQAVQNAVVKLCTYLIMRFQVTPEMRRLQMSPESHPFPPPVGEFMDMVLKLTNASPPLPPRYQIVAHITLLIMMLPTSSAEDGAVLMRHFMSKLTSELQSLRSLALLGILFLDSHSHNTQEDKKRALGDAISAVLSADACYCSTLVTQLGHSHNAQLTASGEDTGSRGHGSLEGRLVHALSMGVNKALQWPTDSQPTALKEGTFVVMHARVVQVLCRLAPEVIVPALFGPLRAALGGDASKAADKSMLYSAAECVAGIIASTAASQLQEGGSAWEVWLQPLLHHALLSAGSDVSEVWALAIRFGARGLLDAGHSSGLAGIMAEAALPVDPGSPSWVVVKRVKLLHHLLAEVTANEPLDASCKRTAEAFRWKILEELPQLMNVSGEAVRQSVAQLTVELCSSLITNGKAAQEMAAEGSVDSLQVVSVDGSGSPGEATAGGASPLAMDCADDEDAVLLLSQRHATLQQAVETFMVLLVDRMRSGVTHILNTMVDTDEVSSGNGCGVGVVKDDQQLTEKAAALKIEPMAESPTGGSTSTTTQHAVSDVHFTIQVVICALRNNRGPALSQHLIALMPHLIKIQDLAPLELQPLAMDAKVALSLLKYLPIYQRQQVRDVVEVLSHGSQETLYTARAASLVFAQYFWFRNMFLLAKEDVEAVLQLTVARLTDKKLEVRELAAKTLSGMLKLLPDADFQALLQRFLGQVDTYFPAKRARSKKARASAPSSSVESRHGSVLGLKAFVLSSPYSLPQWMAKILTTLARLTPEPPPIRTTAQQCLAEFRRTHEEAELNELQGQLSPEEWEAVLEVSAPATYFV